MFLIVSDSEIMLVPHHQLVNMFQGIHLLHKEKWMSTQSLKDKLFRILAREPQPKALRVDQQWDKNNLDNLIAGTHNLRWKLYQDQPVNMKKISIWNYTRDHQ